MKKPLTAVYWEVGYVLLACTLIAISVQVGKLLAGCIVVLMYVARELCDGVAWQQFLVLAQQKLVQGPSAAGLPSALSKNGPSLPDLKWPKPGTRFRTGEEEASSTP